MNTKEIGNAGEAVVLAKFAKLGIQVYTPFGEGSRTDLVADFNGKLQKIQVKSVLAAQKDQNRYSVKLTSNYARRVHRIEDIQYDSNEVDYFAIYCFDRPEPILVPYEEVAGQKSVNIRYATAKSKQGCGVRYEADFLFEEQIDPAFINNVFFRKYKQEEFEERQRQRAKDREVSYQICKDIQHKNPLSKEERESYAPRCIDCGKIISKGAIRCSECSHIQNRKVIRPSREELKKLVREYSFRQLGKQFGVSDKCIVKWCLLEGIPSRKKDIKKYTEEEWHLL